MKDLLVLGALTTAFAALVTLHVAIAVRLLLARPRWRGLVALVVPPLAPFWAFREGWTRSGAGWLAAVLLYLAARLAAAA